MGTVGVVGVPPALGHHFPSAQQHEAVQGIDRILGRIDEAENGLTGDALSLGGTALKGGDWLVGVEHQHK